MLPVTQNIRNRSAFWSSIFLSSFALFLKIKGAKNLLVIKMSVKMFIWVAGKQGFGQRRRNWKQIIESCSGGWEGFSFAGEGYVGRLVVETKQLFTPTPYLVIYSLRMLKHDGRLGWHEASHHVVYEPEHETFNACFPGIWVVPKAFRNFNFAYSSVSEWAWPHDKSVGGLWPINVTPSLTRLLSLSLHFRTSLVCRMNPRSSTLNRCLALLTHLTGDF